MWIEILRLLVTNVLHSQLAVPDGLTQCTIGYIFSTQISRVIRREGTFPTLKRKVPYWSTKNQTVNYMYQ